MKNIILAFAGGTLLNHIQESKLYNLPYHLIAATFWISYPDFVCLFGYED